MKKDRYPKRTLYYNSFEGEFVDPVSAEKRIDKSYKYIRKNPLWRAAAFVAYRLIATPAAFVYTKLFLRQKTVGRSKLRGHRSFMLYCSHNEPVGDAFTPAMISFPRKAYVVVSPANVLLPVIGRVNPMLGALPTPSDLRAARNFQLAIDELLRGRCAVTVYPEAHVWPKCSFVRPFATGAFDPAVRSGAAVFCATRVYKRSRFFGYKCRVYIDGPFYPNTDLSRSAAAADLCDAVRRTMSERMRDEGEVEIIRYLKSEVKNDE